ncbi:hypothetical protein HGA34_05470 [Candidatus Falkowbacteria bacterium]|nr:hypothetical protein [Candidatus Falkowbacteria bacterium]
MPTIYGVDTEKSISPEDVRDAIVECFVAAHQEQLDELKDYVDDESKDNFEEMKRINVRQLMRSMFSQAGGDFDNPSKEAILAALEEIKKFAVNFRNQKIVAKHYGEIAKLVALLK